MSSKASQASQGRAPVARDEQIPEVQTGPPDSQTILAPLNFFFFIIRTFGLPIYLIKLLRKCIRTTGPGAFPLLSPPSPSPFSLALTHNPGGKWRLCR